LILTFEDGEDEILNHIMSYVSTGTKVFQSFVSAKKKLIFSDLEIDITKRLVKKQQEEIILTFTEFEILLLLAQNAGIVFSKEQIYDGVWKEPYFGDYNIVMSHIRNIREKIEDNPSKPVYIQTVWGVGYRFNQTLQIRETL
jgi:DNA-binding response OmpR family regulator